MKRIPERLDVNEHGNLAWGRPRCHVWNKPEDGAYWACDWRPKHALVTETPVEVAPGPGPGVPSPRRWLHG